jgi:hypothetical protein
MLVSKALTNLTDKMHLKKLLQKKHAKLGLPLKMAVFVIFFYVRFVAKVSLYF